MKIYFKTPIPNDYRTVFSKFNLDLFIALKPPMTSLKVERFDGCKKGHEVHLKVSGQKWISHITEDFENDEKIFFVDEGFVTPFPIKTWKHVHLIIKTGQKSCDVIDDIEYSTGLKALDVLIYPFLWGMFSLRAPVYKRELS